MLEKLASARRYANYDYTVELDRFDNRYVVYVHYGNGEIEIYKNKDDKDYFKALTTFYAVCESNGMTEIRDFYGNRYCDAPLLEKIGA